MKKYSAIMVDDIGHEIEIKKEERETIRTSHKIMKSAVNIINGNSDRKLIFDQAMEYIVDDIGMRIGEMERFMDVSADFMNGMDLEQGMLEEQGLKAIKLMRSLMQLITSLQLKLLKRVILSLVEEKRLRLFNKLTLTPILTRVLTLKLDISKIKT